MKGFFIGSCAGLGLEWHPELTCWRMSPQHGRGRTFGRWVDREGLSLSVDWSIDDIRTWRHYWQVMEIQWVEPHCRQWALTWVLCRVPDLFLAGSHSLTLLPDCCEVRSHLPPCPSGLSFLPGPRPKSSQPSMSGNLLYDHVVTGTESR